MAKQTFTTGQVLTAAQMTSLQQTAMGGGSTTAKTTSYTLVAADAGTVVQMNSASATTITVNTSLFAAGDTVQIQNVGAGVCTVTAGTATVNTAGSLALSQYEGGQLYFTAASAALFFDTVQSFSSTFVGCSLTKVANQTTSAATYTVIAFTSEEFDTNGFHDNSTNTGRITIPSGYAGKYLITGQLTTADGNETHTSAIKKNGSNFNTLTSFRSTQSGAGGSVQTLIMNLAVADYVEIAQYSTSGVQVNGTAANDRPSVFACQYLGA